MDDCHLEPKKKSKVGVIAYSLFGSGAMYMAGMIENAKAARYLYPGWTVRVYVDDTVPQDVVKALKSYKAEVVVMPRGHHLSGMFWRFLVADEPGFERWMVRDADSRLTYRERRAVDEWVESGLGFHVLRDHPWHYVNRDRIIMGCGFGAVRGVVQDMAGKIDLWRKAGGAYGPYGADEQFLAKIIWPAVKDVALRHDSTAGVHEGNTKPFPTPMEFGAVRGGEDARGRKLQTCGPGKWPWTGWPGIRHR